MLRCGLLGRKLGHSYSPAIHAMLGDYRYDLIELPPQALEDFVKSDRWDGLNVTIPYKKDVVPFCDELSPGAKARKRQHPMAPGRQNLWRQHRRLRLRGHGKAAGRFLRREESPGAGLRRRVGDGAGRAPKPGGAGGGDLPPRGK